MVTTRHFAIVSILITSVLFVREVKAENMEIIDNIAERLMLFIHPSGEDEEDFVEVQSVCVCVTKKAYKDWPVEQFIELGELLANYSEETEVVMRDTALLLKNGPPRPSERLFQLLEQLGEYVESCETELGARVEF